jgi:hypothetical protein
MTGLLDLAFYTLRNSFVYFLPSVEFAVLSSTLHKGLATHMLRTEPDKSSVSMSYFSRKGVSDIISATS